MSKSFSDQLDNQLFQDSYSELNASHHVDQSLGVIGRKAFPHCILCESENDLPVYSQGGFDALL
jgi:hypothetical protein